MLSLIKLMILLVGFPLLLGILKIVDLKVKAKKFLSNLF